MPPLKRLRKLSRQRRARSEEHAYVIDGPTLLAEAVRSGRVEIEQVLAEPEGSADLPPGLPLEYVPAGALAKATDTKTPQPVAAIARIPEVTVDQLDSPTLILVLVGVNDPGNAGTLLRSLDAAAASGAAVFCDESVDPYSPKCVRAAAGSLFRLPVVRESSSDKAFEALRASGVQLVGTSAHEGTPYDRLDLSGPTAFVLGSEAHGLPDAVVKQLDTVATIPTQGLAESLNVAMAGTLLCFEALRRGRNTQNRLDDAPS